MAGDQIERYILQRFADILDYPQPGLAGAVRECEALIALRSPEAAALLSEFGTFAAETPPERLEELYTATFELDAVCHPYVGHHLFGESYKRSVFLVGLKERYHTHGFAVEKELPDHLGVMLRFLAVCEDAELAREIVHEALLPALERMTRGEDEAEPPTEGEGQRGRRSRQPYRQALQALQLVLPLLLTNDERRTANEARLVPSAALGTGVSPSSLVC